MNPNFAWIGTVAAVLVAALIAIAAGSGGGSASYQGLSVVWICVNIAFIVQWLGFAVAYAAKSERFFDALGSLTFLSVTWLAIGLSGNWDLKTLLVGGMVSIWAIRLGGFLTARIIQAGHDRRFNTIKTSVPLFFMTWTLQGLWVTATLAPALVLFTTSAAGELEFYFYTGAVIWLSGFLIEVIADQQKHRFRQQPENEDRFISTGLWAWSQHPNYFGEVLLWLGVAVIVFPLLSGWQYATLISPIFVYLLLVHISGVRMLDARANRKWEADADYQTYIANTPTLLPRPPK